MNLLKFYIFRKKIFVFFFLILIVYLKPWLNKIIIEIYYLQKYLDEIFKKLDYENIYNFWYNYKKDL